MSLQCFGASLVYDVPDSDSLIVGTRDQIFAARMPDDAPEPSYHDR